MQILTKWIPKMQVWLLGSQDEQQQVFYIHGSDTLPPPLTPAEETAAFETLLRGDADARNTLIIHNLRLLVYIARKFESACVTIEYLISIGTIGLIKAVETFHPEKNIKLATSASRCIENEILMRAVSHLSPREQQIMEMRFGLRGGEEKTQKEVADAIGISQSYISRLEKKIIRRLKTELEEILISKILVNMSYRAGFQVFLSLRT